jgi:EpsI family protein
VLMRTYVNSKGQQVLLALAYGKSMRQEVKIHRPELCYYAQGFDVKSLLSSDFGIVSAHSQPIVGKNMLAVNQNYQEAVSYWIRIGDLYSQSPWQTRFYIIKRGLVGDVVDGVLVRASVVLSDTQPIEEAYQLNKVFLQELAKHLPSDVKNRLLR